MNSEMKSFWKTSACHFQELAQVGPRTAPDNVRNRGL